MYWEKSWRGWLVISVSVVSFISFWSGSSSDLLVLELRPYGDFLVWGTRLFFRLKERPPFLPFFSSIY